MELIKNQAELTKAIDAWGKRGKKWLTEGHHLAMSALSILAEHGDIMPANRLYLAMPKGSKTGAMAEWLLAFGSLVPNEDAVAAKAKPFVHTKDKKVDLVAAAKKPWYEFQPEKAVVDVFDAQAMLIAALQRVIKGAAAATTVQHAELIERATEFMATIDTELGAEAAEEGAKDGHDEALSLNGEALM